MYALVIDIEAYPDFLPWCRAASVQERADGHTVATVEMHKGPVRHSFTTRNSLIENERVEMRLVRGPFRQLLGLWEFQSLAQRACKVTLHLEFELSSALVRAAIGSAFNDIASTMVDAFCKRAVVVYGK
jgi:ribosome-associated toxin RatA of RatAB toxin-antitoxin module